MFRPRTMTRIDVLLMQRDLAVALRALAEARILHLCRVQADLEAVEGGAPSGDLEDSYQNFLSRADRLAGELCLDPCHGRLVRLEDFATWDRDLARLEATLGRLQQRRRELQRLRFRLLALAAFLRRSGLDDVAPGEIFDLRFTAVRLGHLPAASLDDLTSLPRPARAYPLVRSGDRQLVTVLGLRRQERDMDNALTDLSFEAIHGFHRIRQDRAAVLARLRRLLRHLGSRHRRLEEKIAALRRTRGDELADRCSTVAAELQLTRRQRDLAFTRRTVVIAGWVPGRRLGELETILNASCRHPVEITPLPARGDEVPVLISNPGLLRPFQKILAAYGTPTYGELEPTPLLAFGFLLLFGMMFGDVGHGAVMILAGLGLRRWSRFRDEGLIIAEVGCFSALFGFLFGAVFGWETIIPALWFSPLHDIPRLMVAALAVGVILMVAGMSLRIYNGVRQEPFAAVFTDRYGVAGMVFYLGTLVLGLLVYHGRLPVTALVLLLLPLAAIFWHPFTVARREEAQPAYLLCAEGLIGVLETVLGFLANTFSFLRVAAFGLAHAGLALAILTLAEEAGGLPFGGVVAALVHIAGNLVVLVLEGLIVSIQTVRLEFYEFFGKFFRGGGVVFSPLSLENGTERRT